MDEASQLALEKAFDLAERVQGQPWPVEAILEKAAAIRGFLEEPHLGETVQDQITTLQDEMVNIQDRLSRLEDTTPSPARQRSKSSTTETTPPDIDIQVPDPIPTVEF